MNIKLFVLSFVAFILACGGTGGSGPPNTPPAIPTDRPIYTISI